MSSDGRERVLAQIRLAIRSQAPLGDGGAHGLEQVARRPQVVVDAVRDHLGVGLGGELVTLARRLGAQLLVVLDDAVVDDRDAVPGDVRVGVALARHAVRGPAGVRDAEAAVLRFPEPLTERPGRATHRSGQAIPRAGRGEHRRKPIVQQAVLQAPRQQVVQVAGRLPRGTAEQREERHPPDHQTAHHQRQKG